jgi:hypothetical protein
MALECLGKGWCVIPAQPRGKKPLIEWRRFIDRRPTSQEVEAWWAKWPDANVVIVTGRVSGLVVVDVDVKRGADPAKAYEQYPTGLASRTGGGGAHLFYAYPEGVEHVPNRVGKDGFDVRADGGYVVAPPSIHPDTGRAYAWVSQEEPGECPEWVLAPPAEEEEEGKDKWLSELLEGCDAGGRNNACARIAGYFAAKGMAFGIAISLLKQWNKGNKPPLSKGEIKTTLASVYRTAERNGTLRKARERTKDADEQQQKSGNFELMDFRRYMATFGDVAVRWQIEDWIPQQTIAFVVSPPGSYKTWLTFDLAIAVASGRPFLGHFPVKDPGPVFLVQQEDFHGQIAERLATVTVAKFNAAPPAKHEQGDDFQVQLPPDLPIFIHTERRLRFGDPEIMGALRKRIAEIKPRLVIIDPLYSAGSTEDFMAKTAEQMFILKRLRDEFGCSFVVVHHTKKGSDEEKEGAAPKRESIWGSQFLNAFLETGWQIRRTDEANCIKVKRHFKVKGDSDLIRLSWEINTERAKGPYRYDIAWETIDDEAEDKKVDLLGALERLGPCNVSDLAKDVGLHKSSVSRRLAKLCDNGLVVKDKEGRYVVQADGPAF